MNISDFKKKFFSNQFLPRWVGIDACFCFCAALLCDREGDGQEIDDSFSMIDLSQRLERYPAPSDIKLKGSTPKVTSFLSEVDSLLRELLQSGAVRIRARDEFYELNHDYHQFRSLSDRWEDDSGKLWHDVKAIDYQNKKIVLHSDPQGFLDRCIGDYDYDLQTQGHGELTSEVHSAIVEIEVSSADLLDNLSSLIESYRPFTPVHSVNIDEKVVTGKNRFYYSSKLGRWIVEFNGAVDTYEKAIDSKPFELLQYLLKHSLTKKGLNEYHLYLSVNNLGFASGEEQSDITIDTIYEAGLQHSSADKLDNKDADTSIENLKKVEQKLLRQYQRSRDDQDIFEQLELVREYIKKESFNGRAKVKTDSSKIKNRVKTTLSRAISEQAPQLQQHLSDHIRREREHIYYNAELSWITSPDQVR